VGDLVRISEARPMSREKRWVVEEIMAEGSPVAMTEAIQ
jgi:ribosomal protein S17